MNYAPEPCPHGAPRDHGVIVVELPPNPHRIEVHCPCCGMKGDRHVNDAGPMPCPVCKIEAVVTDQAGEETP